MELRKKAYEKSKLALENRIQLLEGRPGSNTSIINKLRRQLKHVEDQYAAYVEAAGSEPTEE